MINLLIAGYHGFGNCGDEATLLAITTNIRKMSSDVVITALSYDPEFTKTEYNIESVQRFNAWQVFKAIKKSDIILSGGGTLLQDGTSTRSLMYYLSIIKIAKIFHKRVMLYANGIGPVDGSFNRKMIKAVVNNVDIITLREELSEKDLKMIGVTKPKIFVTADPAFTLNPVNINTAFSFLKSEGVPVDKEILGISVRRWDKAFGGNDNYISELAKVCDYFARKGKTVLFIPMQFPKDIAISKKLMDNMKEKSYILQNEYNPKQLLGIIGCVKVLLSMRLHTLIFAGVNHIPMLGIIYDPKVEYYLKVLKMPSVGDIRKEKLDSEKIIKMIDNTFDNYNSYLDILENTVSHLIKKASENDEFLYEQLEIIRKSKRRRKK